MPTVYSLKPRFQTMLRPIARRLVAMGATANEVTLAAGALSIGTGLSLWLQPAPGRWFLVLPTVLFIRMALNALDGLMAREFNQQSSLGTYLNELVDVISDAFLILPFARVPGVNPAWIPIVIILAAISEMTGALGATIGASRRCDGPMGKSDRAVAFGALAIWLGAGLTVSPPAMALISGFIPSLIVWTICNRVRGGLAETRS